MKKKRISVSILLLMSTLLIAFHGCSASQPEIPYDNHTHAADLEKLEPTQTIDNLALPHVEAMARSIVYPLEDLKADQIVKLVRYHKGRYYSVTPVANGKYLFLLYGKEAPYHVVDGFLASSFADKNRFKDIAPGMKQKDILLQDPSSFVSENYSYHRFSDNSMLTIKYGKDSNGEPVVSEYAYTSDAESVLNYLTSQDTDLLLNP